jgi:hypothetical protein
MKFDDTGLHAGDADPEPGLWWSGRQWADEAGHDADEPIGPRSVPRRHGRLIVRIDSSFGAVRSTASKAADQPN